MKETVLCELISSDVTTCTISDPFGGIYSVIEIQQEPPLFLHPYCPFPQASSALSTHTHKYIKIPERDRTTNILADHLSFCIL